MISQVENQIGQLNTYNAHLNHHAMNNHPPLAATDSLLATVSSKTHYYRAENRTIHISMADLFGRDEFGLKWFENAHNFNESMPIRVTNRDTGNSAEFKYLAPAIQHSVGVRGGSPYRQVTYVFSGNISGTDKWLDLKLVLWEKKDDLQEWIAYMTEDQGVTAN